MKRLLIYFAIILSISGCKCGERPELVTVTDTDHFVHGYWIYDDIELEARIGVMGGDKDGYYAPVLKIKLPESAYMVSYLSVGDMLEEYLALCRKYDDFGVDPFYGGSRDGFAVVNRPINVFSGIEFSSVDIVSNTDFDEEHPAGTSLADIAMLSTWWGMPYLDRHNKQNTRGPYADGSWFEEGLQTGMQLFERLCDLTPYHLSVIGMQDINSSDEYWQVNYKRNFCVGAITFSQVPTCGLKHTFTVTMTTVDGRKFEAQVYAYWY